MKFFLTADRYSLEKSSRFSNMVAVQGFDPEVYTSRVRPFFERLSRCYGAPDSLVNFFAPPHYHITSANLERVVGFLDQNQPHIDLNIASVANAQDLPVGIYRLVRDRHGTHEKLFMGKRERSILKAPLDYFVD